MSQKERTFRTNVYHRHENIYTQGICALVNDVIRELSQRHYTEQEVVDVLHEALTGVLRARPPRM